MTLGEKLQMLRSHAGMSQEELADILAANRVNLSRNLSRLRQEGVIATSRKQIRILRPDLLAARCSSETL